MKTSRFGMIFLMSVFLLLLGGKCDSPQEHAYPRLCIHENEWTTEVPRDTVYQYGMVSGGARTHLVMLFREQAIADGKKDWLKSTLFAQQDCPLTARYDWCKREQYPSWLKPLENPGDASEVAVWHNYKAGCNWFVLDTTGEPLPVWGSHHCALDMTEFCPKGVWGPTAGLTYAEFLSSDAWLDVFTETDWDIAFNIYRVEDGPTRGTACWSWKNDLIRCGDMLLTCEQYRDEYAWPAMNVWLETCVKKLRQRGVIMCTNGHFSPANPRFTWPEIGQTFATCELEGFGSWGHEPGSGAWPGWNLLDWTTVYFGVEEFFEPWMDWEVAEGTRFDGYQGTDLALCQIRIGAPGYFEHQKKMVALVLMDDAFYSLVRFDDEDGIFRVWEPIPRAPELDIHLGKALGPRHEYSIGDYTIYWRYFKQESGLVQTVVFNPNPVAVEGLEPESGTWFVGKWRPE